MSEKRARAGPLAMNHRRSATPSLEASQQQHIEQLVQEKRSLEATIKKINASVDQEKARSKSIAAELQAKWKSERQTWHSGVDILQILHRLVQLRASDDLEKERMNVLAEQDGIRREKIARLQRDFKIAMFQAKESELEARIEDLEDENAHLSDVQAAIISTSAEELSRQAKAMDELQAKLEATEVCQPIYPSKLYALMLAPGRTR
jgi:chromosome segregation ATPase